MSDFQALTKEAENLLSRGRDHRRTEQQLLQLKLHLKMIASWADHVPPETRFFFVEWQLVLIVPRVDGLSREELAIAAISATATLPTGRHRSASSVEGESAGLRTLCNALNAGDLIVAATMARSLMETTAAFGCQSDQIARLWRIRTRQPAPDAESLQEFMESANAVVGQILIGMKLRREKTPKNGDRAH